MMRECKACEGTGYDVAPCLRAISHDSDICSCLDHPCQACLGSGQVSERIPASDALADAETLTLAYQHPGKSKVGHARMFGFAARQNANVPDDAARWAGHAARAAFRAVPGLRG